MFKCFLFAFTDKNYKTLFKKYNYWKRLMYLKKKYDVNL